MVLYRTLSCLSFLNRIWKKFYSLILKRNHVQAQCAAIKAEIVSQDEKESGIRIILNCGHTIGHGLEFAGHYKLIKHGEAVLLGLIAESFIAKEMKLLDADSYERIIALIRRVPMKMKLSSLKIADIAKCYGT